MEYKNLLLDDLIIKHIKKNDEKAYQEIIKRLKFCGFNDYTIECIIGYESNIINHGKIRNKLICDNYFLIPYKNSDIIFSEPSKCIYKLDENVFEETLLISELLAIIDEANIISYSNKLNEYKNKNEIKNLSLENSNNWLIREYNNRLGNICRFANNISNLERKSLFKKNYNILYDNEMQIIMNNRWENLEIRDKLFEPYSEEYFDKLKKEE